MEPNSGETPKPDQTVNLKVPDVESKELEQKAQKLAEVTRQNGIVNMFLGQRLSRNTPPPVDSFIQGVAVDISSRRKKTVPSWIWIGEEAGALFDMLPFSDMHGDRYGYQALASPTAYKTDCQIWTMARYVPPMKKELVDEVKEVKTKRLGFIPKTEKHIEKVLRTSNEPLSYDGRKGEPNWTRYNYYMRRYDKGEDRQGGSLSVLSVAVPPHIAAQIDDEVAKNVYFPDAFLKALYPEYIGPDLNKNLKRFPTTELRIVDCRSKPEKDSVLKYSQPLPY